MGADGRITCTRRLEWDAMHRIPGHEGDCRAYHGHRYAADVTCRADALDRLGRVIDFSVIKSEIGGWIAEHFDHNAIFQRDDPDEAIAHIVASNKKMGKQVYFLDGPPTAENIALELAQVTARLLAPHAIDVTEIRVWETPNCYATWSSMTAGTRTAAAP